MKKTRTPSARSVIRIENALAPEFRAWLDSRPRPFRLCGVRVPETLDGLTFGDLIQCQEIAGMDNRRAVVILAGAILHPRRPGRILDERADAVFGFINWTAREVERINGLFQSIEHTPTADERAAGVESLQFGTFGLLDWYARRMGITDHDAVLRVSWLRIFECARMDAERDAYERRLRDILNAKLTPKK